MKYFQGLFCFACDVNYSVFMAVAVHFGEEAAESFKSCPFNKDLLRCLDILLSFFLGTPMGVLGTPGKQMYLNSQHASGL